MNKHQQLFYTVNTVTAYHELLHLDKPEHPMVSVVDFSKVNYSNPMPGTSVILNLYCISLKQGADCVLRYGPKTYDFSEGVMSFFKPGQVLSVGHQSENVTDGYMLTFHPDFIQSFALSNKIRKYGFFDYRVTEALFLSEKEKKHIREIMAGIEQEYQTNIDGFSQEAIVSYIDLLLVYGNRYYNRQFITRKPQSDDLSTRFEQLLDEYFSNEDALVSGLPSVQYFADRLHLSPNYLGEMLRVSTGQSAQHHIQNKIIELAKTLLSTTRLSVAEIAYQLGFERPQSLNRLFKSKTNSSPLEYRASFN
ncbi:helix-turn-helix domain-containing protein [Parapedobacter koreensis]|uniref:AraC-like ligand binding domain-containing protein n=1 Tax=Parapedobacter koreensis TaxID=332977 RepID=A0A1H7LRT9_9SPHI|nr:helix-turn-helix domain-containing protein [Parapedobacter koreensis]SEL01630.1 AraC-like ligand binding domain-containing protein [Parapedobacter koreensis]